MRTSAALFFTFTLVQTGAMGVLAVPVMSALVCLAVVEDFLTLRNKR